MSLMLFICTGSFLHLTAATSTSNHIHQLKHHNTLPAPQHHPPARHQARSEGTSTKCVRKTKTHREKELLPSQCQGLSDRVRPEQPLQHQVLSRSSTSTPNSEEKDASSVLYLHTEALHQYQPLRAKLLRRRLVSSSGHDAKTPSSALTLIEVTPLCLLPRNKLD
ncbi:hypothetical protein BKA64DRAFT_681854 [Cadophora sp. MPI-SDFR-AT-0126]|nr:hypothetical protein BKA64DRAFT_681854 [Leotiomycetes sp. MPI-SDFR-AT-0126]